MLPYWDGQALTDWYPLSAMCVFSLKLSWSLLSFFTAMYFSINCLKQVMLDMKLDSILVDTKTILWSRLDIEFRMKGFTSKH